LCQSITVNEEPMLVTSNLYDALVQLQPRHGQLSLLLWVDVICFNQLDEGEKSVQVGMMAQIYASASSMVIWLGENFSHKEWDRLAFETLLSSRQPWTYYSTPHAEDALSSKRFVQTSSVDYKTPLDVMLLSHLKAKTEEQAREATDTATTQEGGKSTGLRSRLRTFSNRKLLSIDPLDPATTRQMLLQNATYEAVMQVTATDLHLQLLHRYFHCWPRESLPSALDPQYLNMLVRVVVERLRAVTELLGRRYFSRRWILQEMYESQTARTMVRWGRYCCSFSDFFEKSKTLGELLQHCHRVYEPEHDEPFLLRQVENEVISQASDTLRILNVRNVVSDQSDEWKFIPRPLRCFHAYAQSECADERDILFTFASLSEGCAEITPDYSKSTSSTYTAFARSLAVGGY
jgi:hypothetical protein